MSIQCKGTDHQRARRTGQCSKLVIAALIAVGAPACSSSPQVAGLRSVPELLRPFAYDATLPLDVQITGSEKRDNLTVHKLTYASPKGGRVSANLVVPDGSGPFPAVIVMHGAPGGTAEGMLPEMIQFARRGAIAMAIDAPFARGQRRGKPAEVLHFDQQDRIDQIQLNVDLRRAVDLLVARPDVDRTRLAYVGRSYGAAQGALLAGTETRLKVYALVVGDGGLVSHFTGPDKKTSPLDGLDPKKRDAWLSLMKPIEPLSFIGRAKEATFLFQNGRQDGFVSIADAEDLQRAATGPKKVLWYDAGHALNDRATRDRLEWVSEQLGLHAKAS